MSDSDPSPPQGFAALRQMLSTVLQVSPSTVRAGVLTQVHLLLATGGATSRQMEVVQFLRDDQIPAPGDVVYLTADPAGDDRWLLTGSPASPPAQPSAAASSPSVPVSTAPPPSTPPTLAPPAPAEPSSGEELQAAAFTPHLRNNGELGIATVLDVAQGRAGLTRFGLAVEAIGHAARHLTLNQALPGQPYAAGDRVYLLIDPDHRASMAILPSSATGGQKLPAAMSRLDPYVLGPALLRSGARGTARVLAAEPIPLPEPEFAARGFRRFRLHVRIDPENSLPSFDATQEITLTSPAKVVRMATPGAVLPVRFDPAQPHSFTADSLAMGHPDPYEEALTLFRNAVQQG